MANDWESLMNSVFGAGGRLSPSALEKGEGKKAKETLAGMQKELDALQARQKSRRRQSPRRAAKNRPPPQSPRPAESRPPPQSRPRRRKSPRRPQGRPKAPRGRGRPGRTRGWRGCKKTAASWTRLCKSRPRRSRPWAAP